MYCHIGDCRFLLLPPGGGAKQATRRLVLGLQGPTRLAERLPRRDQAIQLRAFLARCVDTVLAREGAFSLAEGHPIPPSAKLMVGIARLIEKRDVRKTGRVTRLANALTRPGPAQ